MLNTLGDSASFRRESLKAIILVIPKDGKDPMQCGSYSPISLLNADLKFFYQDTGLLPSTASAIPGVFGSSGFHPDKGGLG